MTRPRNLELNCALVLHGGRLSIPGLSITRICCLDLKKNCSFKRAYLLERRPAADQVCPRLTLLTPVARWRIAHPLQLRLLPGRARRALLQVGSILDLTRFAVD